MMNFAMLSTLSNDSILPLFPSILGGRNASKLRLQMIEARSLPEYLRLNDQDLMSLLNNENNQNLRRAEDLEEYCTYLHTLVRSVDGARNIPILRLSESWYRFRDAYMDLFILPPHLLMPYLDEKIQQIHNLLVNLENDILNPNLEYSPAELEHEKALIKANHTRVHLVESILKDNFIRNALQQMVEAEDWIERTRFDRPFPDYAQARLMTNSQLNQMERNLMHDALNRDRHG
jgi:hypothetical protein